ncbi:Putative uncharacterized protein [Moritella viscosa]|uniref:type I-F CRISPR-associated protein Csy2 n=1 Tax=Moritella viscosa TaxID=80854 RepID=UPI000920B437|nr:type I-F CRISPR-associated protein Csy2 [Moritella viscosa]SGZ09882.1 Putative uncharacterized protein [Moritella viscosa]
MDLCTLLKNKELNKKELNAAIKRVFSCFSELICVDGSERETVIILANLADKSAHSDLLSRGSAKNIIQDNVMFNSCTEQVSWMHTHNLKYPDARVSKQRAIFPKPEKLSAAISSAYLPEMHGWSYNGKFINHAKLFSTQFIWNKKITNLATLVINEEETWIQQLSRLGCDKHTLKTLSNELKTRLPETDAPKHIDMHSKQVRFPYLDEYCSITPIASHAMLYQMQQCLTNHDLKTAKIAQSHCANIGDLSASTGGHIAMLSYPPSVGNSPFSFTNTRLNNIRNRRIIFDLSVLSSDEFIRYLNVIAGNDTELTIKLKERQRTAALQGIRKLIARWFAPIMELRDSINESNNVDKAGYDSIELQLATIELKDLPSLTKLLNITLHEHLQLSKKTLNFSYHQALIQPLKRQISWLLTQLSLDDEDHATSDSAYYLHFKSLRIEHALALSNPYLVGIPSLTAFGGMMHKFQLRAQKILDAEIKVVSGAWFIHQYNQYNHKILPELRIANKSATKITRNETVDSHFCDLTVDFILKIETDINIIDEIDKIKGAFPSVFAGGDIFPPLLDEMTDWLQIYPDRDKSILFSALGRLPRSGCWISPSDIAFECLDDLFANIKAERELKPIHIGYQFLEEPRARFYSISKYHCYAEPLIGLCRCDSPINIRLKGVSEFFNDLFWRHDVNDNAMLMVKHINQEITHGIL